MYFLEVGMNGVRADVQSGGHFLFRDPSISRLRILSWARDRLNALAACASPMKSNDMIVELMPRNPGHRGLVAHGGFDISRVGLCLTLDLLKACSAKCKNRTQQRQNQCTS